LKTTVNLYLHTHWDREWYLPYETYRAQLLAVVKDIIGKLKRGELPNFLLDGQSCVLQDVLEVDGDLAEPIRALMECGKLSAGPWYVLADQMLVAGESLVRNLKIGLDLTRRYGEPAMVGYCPDTFGHTEDLPRILRGFGIDSAFVWRGVPMIDGVSAFHWKSQDGSEVLAHHLNLGYYQTAFHENKTAQQLVEYLQRFARKDSPMPALVPVGADHMAPPADFSANIKRLQSLVAANSAAKAGNSFSQLEIETKTLPEFNQEWQSCFTAGGAPALATICGELRDNAAALQYERAYMLPGVLSTRLYLKRENRIAEQRLMRLAEPLYTMLALLKGTEYPQAELHYAWKLLLKNHPHDSICGCSIDEVHREMMHRWHKLHHTLNALDGRLVEQLCARAEEGEDEQCAPNSPRLSLTRLPVLAPDYEPDSLLVCNVSSESVSCPVLVAWAEDPTARDKGAARLNMEQNPNIQLISKELQPMIFSGTGREPDVRDVDLNRAWFWAPDVPAAGMRLFALEQPGRKQTQDSHWSPPPVKVAARRLENGLLTVEVEDGGDLLVTADTGDGTATVYRLAHNIIDSGDGGDTYNFDPLPDDEPLQARVTNVQTWARGPLVGALQITYELELPAGLIENPSVDEDREATACEATDGLRQFSRADRTILHTITTEVSLRRGVPIIFFDTRWMNKSTDHRMEVSFDTGRIVDQSFSENHFSVVRRGHQNRLTTLPVDKGCEAPLDRFPCQRFFIANRQMFLNKGMPEYGAGGTCVTMTILRAVSRLSRPRLMTRGGGAGPPVATPEANCLGLNQVSYGWAPLSEHSDSEQLAQAYRLAELFEGPMWTVAVRADGEEETQILFGLDNRAIRLAALYTNDSRVFVRLLNVSQQNQKLRLTVNVPGVKVFIANLDQLLGDQLKPSAAQTGGPSTFTLEFGKCELVTLALISSNKPAATI
jgi:hypothetical protein